MGTQGACSPFFDGFWPGQFNAVGTQAAVLAGFALTALAEVDVPPSCERVGWSLPFHFEASAHTHIHTTRRYVGTWS